MSYPICPLADDPAAPTLLRNDLGPRSEPDDDDRWIITIEGATQ